MRGIVICAPLALLVWAALGALACCEDWLSAAAVGAALLVLPALVLIPVVRAEMAAAEDVEA